MMDSFDTDDLWQKFRLLKCSNVAKIFKCSFKHLTSVMYFQNWMQTHYSVMSAISGSQRKCLLRTDTKQSLPSSQGEVCNNCQKHMCFTVLRYISLMYNKTIVTFALSAPYTDWKYPMDIFQESKNHYGDLQRGSTVQLTIIW